MKQHECAVGFVLDPDADRLALIDETGTCVSEEVTLALAVKYRLRQQRGPVVINMSTSRMVEDMAAAARLRVPPLGGGRGERRRPDARRRARSSAARGTAA